MQSDSGLQDIKKNCHAEMGNANDHAEIAKNACRKIDSGKKGMDECEFNLERNWKIKEIKKAVC